MLDKISCKLLAYIRKHGAVTNIDIKEHFGSELISEISLLQKQKYLKTTITEFDNLHGFLVSSGHSYEITPDGRAYLENRLSEKVFKLVPIIISVLSLLLSVFNTLKIYNVF